MKAFVLNATGGTGRLSRISWRQVLPLVLAAFFVVGSLSNILAPRSIFEE